MPVDTHKETQKGSNQESMQSGTRMMKLENAGPRAPRKMCLGSGLHSQKRIRAPVSKMVGLRAPGSTAEISGLQGPPFGPWILIPPRFLIISNLAIGISDLLSAAFSPATIFHSHLQACLGTFYKFYHSVFHLALPFLPISPTFMALFIEFMFNFHYAPSTVTTYVSALGWYSHKLLGFPDPSNVFCFPNPQGI